MSFSLPLVGPLLLPPMPLRCCSFRMPTAQNVPLPTAPLSPFLPSKPIAIPRVAFGLVEHLTSSHPMSFNPAPQPTLFTPGCSSLPPGAQATPTISNQALAWPSARVNSSTSRR